MRFVLAGIVLLLALPLAAPAAPALCADPCSIAASSQAYVPPVAEIASGSRVLFTSTDIGHFTTDFAAMSSRAPCFGLAQSPDLASPPLTFTITGGQLVASYVDDAGTHTAVCQNAVALPGGGFALPFLCRIHSNMRGMLVVEP